MKKNLHNNAILRAFFSLIVLSLGTAGSLWSQCTNTSAFGTIAAPTNNTTATITTCAYAGEYSTVTGCTAGTTYLFNATGGAGNYITIRQGTSSGTVLGFGTPPVSVTCTVSGSLYLHYNLNAACGTESACRTGTVQCTSCAGTPDPCTSISTLTCGTAVSATMSGSGLWSPGSCGFSTPGTEKVYSFTAPSTGAYTLQVNSVSGSTYVDYFYKAASSGCSSSGWTCIGDVNAAGTRTIGTLTAGTTYYFLLDPESTTAITHNFQIVCPVVFDPCASIPTMTCTTPVTASTTGTGVWSPGSCGFSTPGKEQIYSFTPTVTGNYTLVITATNSLYADYFFKAASGGCNASGWTCIGDASLPESNTFGPLTAGTTYYILFDPESSASAVTQTFRIDCPPSFDPCASIPTMTCATPVTASTTGAGVWSPGNCGFSTPGKEQVYSFTPTVTGNHTLVITATNSLYADYFYKAASGGCSSSGWTCIGDASLPESNTFGPLTAGTTYYILFDPESSASTVTQTFRIDCPPGGSAPSCIAAPTAPANGSNAGCPATTQTLSWPVAAGATSYDVYFGAGTTPPFVGNTTSTSFITTSLAAGTYYWQIRPSNSFGTASGCAVWSFTKVDITAPTITCPASTTTTNSPSTSCSAVVIYTAPTVSDNCGLLSTIQTGGLPSGATYPVGVTTNTWRVTDVNSNTATCSFTVTVTDATLPAITCPPNINVNNSPSTSCSAVVIYTAPTVSDNCGLSSTTQTGGLASGATFPVGVTTNTWRATDLSGNTKTCSFTVTVIDATLPTITCPANITRNNDAAKCSAVVTYTTPTATDNCSVASVVLQSGLSSGSAFPVGTTTNVWRATDVNSNFSTCSFTVKVNDVELPTINCPPNLEKSTDPGQCSANLGVYIGTTTFSDNCGISAISNNSPGVFQVGTTTVVWTAQDFSNNTRTCAQTITIKDNEWPAVHCPANISVKTDEGDCLATVQYAATASDNCSGVQLDYSTASPASFDLGLTNVQVTATDASGNSSSCEFQVSVSRRAELCNGLDDDCDGLVDEAEDWTALAKRLAANGAASESYGSSVDIWGDYAIVGANRKNASGQSIGAAYILFRDQNGVNKWGQATELSAPGLAPGDDFGHAVAIGDGIAAVGAPQDDQSAGNAGAVYVFVKNSSSSEWIFAKKITASDAAAADNFGAALALNGDKLLVGAPLSDAGGNNSGAAYMFYRNSGGADQWGQVAKLVPTTGAADDNFGVAVDLDGDRAIVGANGVDGFLPNAGAAYVFGRNQFGADTWGQIARIRANQSGDNDNFGASVAISGPWVFVGADHSDQKGADAGAAFVFYQNQNGILNSWGQSQVIYNDFAQAGDHFGSAVDIDGNYAVVGASGDSPFGQHSGAGYMYTLYTNTWAPAGLLTDGGGQAGDALGSAAAISGRTVILGGPLDNNGQNSDQGSVLVFGGLCNDNFGPEIENRGNSGSAELNADAIQCFPSPFSDRLNIEIHGVHASDLQLTLVNALGQVVTELYRGAVEGDLRLQWTPASSADGLYFLRLRAGDTVLSKAVVRAR